MNAADLPSLPPNMLAVRIGCTLSYQARERAPIVFLVKPRLRYGQLVLDENLTAAMGNRIEWIRDQFGNTGLRTVLLPGRNEFTHDALVLVPESGANAALPASHVPIGQLAAEQLRYLLPSRYCESDLLWHFARERFGRLAPGAEVAQEICRWVHDNIEYRYGSGNQNLSAWGTIRRGYGVCRDFAHVMVALCRAMDLPARYVAGHLPQALCNQQLIAGPAWSDIGTDFHAYVEVFLGGHWHIYDPRYCRPLVGHIKLAHGLDAVDAAFATFFGDVTPLQVKVWSYQVDHALPCLTESGRKSSRTAAPWANA